MLACSFQSASSWTRPCCIINRLKCFVALNVSREKSPFMVCSLSHACRVIRALQLPARPGLDQPISSLRADAKLRKRPGWIQRIGSSLFSVEWPCLPRSPTDTPVTRPAPHGDFAVVPSIRIESTMVRLRWGSRGGLMRAGRNRAPEARLFGAPNSVRTGRPNAGNRQRVSVGAEPSDDHECEDPFH